MCCLTWWKLTSSPIVVHLSRSERSSYFVQLMVKTTRKYWISTFWKILTIAVRCCKSFPPYVIGENSPILSKRNFTPRTCPHGFTFTWWGCYGFSLWQKPTERAHSFWFCSCVCFCLYVPFNCISFHKFSRQLFAFLLCSSGLISALLALSAACLFMKVSLSPDIILCGWLSLKHQMTPRTP